MPIGGPAVADHSRVMIVDDSSSNVLLLERLLQAAGLQHVEGFTDPELALERCSQELPDLLLLDLHMPRVDGFGVLEKLRSSLPEGSFLPVLVLTADASTETKQQALAAGAKDFLTKPFDRIEVILRVRNLLETADLYARLRRHNVQLQAELDDQLERERAAEAEQEARARRIGAVLAGDHPRMVFQPIFDVANGTVVGVEALARFEVDPVRPPREWFAEAAALGRGVELELKAVASALDHLDLLPPEAFMSVNASPVTAVAPGLAPLLTARAGGGHRIVLELTEDTQIHEYEPLLRALEGLRHLGVRIAVDDTGEGYAGLQHLLRIQPNVVKLDIALTRGVDVDPVRRALAAALVMFAHEIGATLIAEGVETAAELQALRHLGVRMAQGFHLARPAPLDAAPGA